MEFRRLRYFIEVAEILNFTRAAEKLHVAQPTISRQIRQLEEELGVDLFVRDRKRILLTAAGQVLLEEAKIIITQYGIAAQRAREASTRVVKVGIGFGLGEQVERVLVRHARLFPAVDVQSQNVPSTPQNTALKRFKIDIGFLRAPIDIEHLSSELLFKEPLFVLLPAMNPLAARKRLRLRQLTEMPLLLARRGLSNGLYDQILHLYKQADISPKVIHTPHTGPLEEAGCILVASNKGFYIASGTFAKYPIYSKGVRAVRLDEPDATIEVHVAWRSDEKSKTVLDFLRSVRATFKTKVR
jgi:LysR family hca operon transcriptional activator